MAPLLFFSSAVWKALYSLPILWWLVGADVHILNLLFCFMSFPHLIVVAVPATTGLMNLTFTGRVLLDLGAPNFLRKSIHGLLTTNFIYYIGQLFLVSLRNSKHNDDPTTISFSAADIYAAWTFWCDEYLISCYVVALCKSPISGTFAFLDFHQARSFCDLSFVHSWHVRSLPLLT